MCIYSCIYLGGVCARPRRERAGVRVLLQAREGIMQPDGTGYERGGSGGVPQGAGSGTFFFVCFFNHLAITKMNRLISVYSCPVFF